MKKYFLLALFSLFCLSGLVAQIHERCATTHVVDHHDQNYPGYKQAVDLTFEQAKQRISSSSQKTNSAHDTIFRIPTVIHLVYTDPQVDSLSDDLLLGQIDVLNRDFRRQNADTTNTRSEFLPVVGDAGIEFYLATTDPSGNPTTGITYTLGTPGPFGFEPFTDNVKAVATGGADPWPTDRYMNIWVCDILNGFGVLGYAFPPAAAPNWPPGNTTDSAKQGVVLHYAVTGPNNPNATGPFSVADQGRTAVHEVGHFLGLRHIWGDGACNEDDGLDDTPAASSDSQASGCSFLKNTCDPAVPGDLPDMVENYMDYSTETCQNSFTNDQIDIMRSMLIIGRPGLADIETTVGIDQVFSRESISLYPNPASSSFNIEFDNQIGLVHSIEIVDVSGSRVYQSEIENSGSSVEINTEDLVQGIYLVKLYSQEGIFTKKLLVE